MNTINSTIKGKAYEYACVLALKNAVLPYRNVTIIANESFEIAKERYTKEISKSEQEEMLLSATSGIRKIIQMEPKIIEDGKDILTISLQPDTAAQKLGDIRDVLIIRRHIKWEIGISVKHNHNTLKHSRLSPHIDFGNSWFGVPCSQNYFKEIEPIFSKLEKYKEQDKNWKDLPQKENSIYVPLLKAFKKEFETLNKKQNICRKLIEYLIGSCGKDYYKLTHKSNHTTTVMPFNLFGTLNQSVTGKRPQIIIPKMDLPTRIAKLEFKENSKTTLDLYLNNGWQISFRIHNASTKVEPSLKFDIQLKSIPMNLFYIDCEW